METAKDYLKTKVDPVVEPLMIDLLANKPADPVGFMLSWLNKKINPAGSAPHHSPLKAKKPVAQPKVTPLYLHRTRAAPPLRTRTSPMRFA